MWTDASRNNKGRIVKEVALELNVIVMNKNPTHYHSQSKLLSYRFNNMFNRLPAVIQDLYNSDHYSTQLKLVTISFLTSLISLILRKHGWGAFRQLSIINLNELPDVNNKKIS